MKKSILFICLMMSMACHKKLSKEEIESELVKTMSSYLNNQPKSITTIGFDVQSVTFFEEKNVYLCEFKIHMKGKNTNDSSIKKIDTTGTMKAIIDKNFILIKRVS